MHELSLAMSMIDVASNYARDEGASRINQIDVEIGILSGILIESFLFCFDVASRESMAEGARLNIISIPGIAECKTCSKTFEVDDFFVACPKCEGYVINIIQGRELRVKSIIID